MKPVIRHSWNLKPSDAITLQRELTGNVRIKPLKKETKTVLGLDVSYKKEKNLLFSGGILLNINSLEVLDEVTSIEEAVFPYIPGLLSFREIPGIITALENLFQVPDVIMCDGHGIVHPRRFGLASHIGVLYDVPSMGVAKKPLTGVFRQPGRQKGSYSEIRDNDELLGYAYRTRTDIKPVYISPGHKIEFSDCLKMIRICSGKYRIPEPTRQAHNLVNNVRKSTE